MTRNQILILLNGQDQRILSPNSNMIILAKEKLENIKQDHTLLQIDLASLEDFIKAEAFIKSQHTTIDELIIINKNIDLNMISYQYDFNHVKQTYQVLTNIIYFINLLIPLFNNNIQFTLSFEKKNHYKVHFNNFKMALLNYLETLKIDLIKSNNIIIKKLD